MYKIGFCSDEAENNTATAGPAREPRSFEPRRSVVQVQFPDNGKNLAYYNDCYDLRTGDLVYVEGKMEGIPGRVTEVNCNFKIKLSEYKRVIALADTEVHGELFMAGSHFVTFDPAVLPAEKVRLWFLPPAASDEEFVSGNDDSAFPLGELGAMNVTPQIASRGHEYYMDNRVKYLSLSGTHGYAIVQGSKVYEVEFELRDGMISNLLCSCFCSYDCKHEFAVMLQLGETLELIGRHYADRHGDYFAAMPKGTLFSYAIDGRESGSFTL